MSPYSLRSLPKTVQRILHNLFAVIVFLSLPALIATFQVSIIPEFKFPGISGLILIGLTVLIVGLSMLKNGITGVSELLFINGISL